MSDSTCDSAPAPCNLDVFNSAIDNAHVLTGALVGGPDANDNYVDDRTDDVMAAVNCEYNSGFQSSLAGTRFLLLACLKTPRLIYAIHVHSM